MEDRTYIKMFRKILAWEWYTDTNTFRVFMHILLRANYKPSRYKGIEIPSGACVFGYNTWANELGMSVRQVRTAIEHLKSTNEITMKSTSKFSIVTLVKWELWQVEDGEATSKATNEPTDRATNSLTSKRQASDKQATTSKESKNTTTTSTTNRGKPKSLDEVRAYVAEKGLVIDPDYFYEYYEENEWKDVKGEPVKSWKLKAQTWSKREQKNGDVNGVGNKTNSHPPSKKTRSEAGDGDDRETGSQSWFIPPMEITF